MLESCWFHVVCTTALEDAGRLDTGWATTPYFLFGCPAITAFVWSDSCWKPSLIPWSRVATVGCTIQWCLILLSWSFSVTSEAFMARAVSFEGEREEGRGAPTALEILLVGQHEKHAVAHFPVVDDAVELGAGLVDAGAVGRVDDENEALGSCGRQYFFSTPSRGYVPL